MKKPKKRRKNDDYIIDADKLLGKISIPRTKYMWIDDGSGNGWWMSLSDGSLSHCYIR